MRLLAFYLLLLLYRGVWSNLVQQNDYPEDIDYLDMDPDSLLAENAIIVSNATCGEKKREYYCRLVEHAGYDFTAFKRTKRQVFTYPQDARTYKDADGSLVECNYCDARDQNLRHPIEYAVSGDSNLWWQSPSLAEGLQYHAVTIDIDLKQVYQIVFVLLRMGDSPRPANWILEKSINGQVFQPWVFFAENAYQCYTLYQPMVNGTLRITSDSRPHKLGNTEVYCTTYFSQPQNLQAGEIIIPLTVDREGASASRFEANKPIDPELIDFLSSRFVRLRFQKLQTLSGDWMTLRDQLDPTVYNRYYYSIRNIKIGGKCICNSHANTCGRQIIDGVPRAVCDCQHNTCGYTCERCCPLFNQQPWRPGAMCEECNCHGKADSCVYNQTVANLQLSLNRYNVREGGGVCIGCRERTTGINCEDCSPGYYRPLNVAPEAKNPCVPCNCNLHGSTGVCVSNDAMMPEKQPGDCICREGFAGRLCDRCAEGYYKSPITPGECLKCPCDVAGSHRGQGYRCQPPCNCKPNVDPDSLCKACLLGHFNLDNEDPEGCQACFCMGLSKECHSVSVSTARRLEQEGKLGTVDTLDGWSLVVPSSPRSLPVPPISAGASVEAAASTRMLRMSSEDAEFSLGPPAAEPSHATYWSAPAIYLGKQLTAYRGYLEVITRFASPSIRSTAAVATSVYDNYTLSRIWITEPDVVIEGHGIRLGYSPSPENRQMHRVQRIRLHESNFRVLVEAGSGNLDRIPIHQTQATGTERQTAYSASTYERGSINRVDYTRAGRPATIVDVMAVLSNVTKLYVKARYTDDQAYSELRRVAMERAERRNNTHILLEGIRSVEECRCPPGHRGTSCEECETGYWRNPSIPLAGQGQDGAITAFLGLMNPIYRRVCVPCECNGRADTCDPNTGHCLNCKYNTYGRNCEQCAPGFHLDPTKFGSDICQPCECPSLSNQKTNSCISLSGRSLGSFGFPVEKPYACIDCEENTRGQFCETCAEMFYGNPLLGQPCRPCDCGLMAIGCDGITGECRCGYHTTGPRCTECEPGSYGDPLQSEPCTPCRCHPVGSRSIECDKETGLCLCKLFYEGRHCDRCVSGRGNVDAGCPFCNCDPLGSLPLTNGSCDPVTGQCYCKPGVGGTLECDRCDDGYYNLGINGCQSCECSNRALSTVCHPTTGQCECGDNVVGQKCDRCLAGYYWNGSEPHCISCDCGAGSLSTSGCDMFTGQCRCAPFVTGRRCDQCEPGFWGPSPQGCKRCPQCPSSRVCDQLTGKCSCPKNTIGDRCETCVPNSYDYNPIFGCKDCNCSKIGSVNALGGCDLVTGQCTCKSGFSGRACDKCALGYYGYPDCKPCMCSLEGTLRNASNGDQLACNPETGACLCKPNVEGEKCDRCIPGSFGLSADYPLGCYACFCFPTSRPPQCEQLKGYRSVPEIPRRLQLVGTDNPYMPGGPVIDLQLTSEVSTGSSQLPDLTVGQSQFKWRFSKSMPTFLILPDVKGTYTRSYGSILAEVHVDCLPTASCGFETSEDNTRQEARWVPSAYQTVLEDPKKVFARMTALNGQLEFEYQPQNPPPHTPVPGGELVAQYNTIWMREDDWVLTRINTQHLRVRPSRAALMLALINITTFSVRLALPGIPLKAISVNYRTRTAKSEALTQLGTPITTIETCVCTDSAKGDHCEMADKLSYFPPIVIKPGPDGTFFDEMTDISKPSDNDSIPAGGKPSFSFEGGGVLDCECNGMATECDQQSGFCINCAGNTAGAHCEVCAEGYSGDPVKGVPCERCRCPSETANYAKTCYSIGSYGQHICECLPGYAGQLCDRCATGYYGDPLMMIPCKPCACNPAGSRHQNCNMKTGQCACLPGVSGRQCDECPEGHIVDAGRCIDCRGECTGELLERAAEVSTEMDAIDLTELARRGLNDLQNRAKQLLDRYNLTGTLYTERELLERASKITDDLSRISLTMVTTLPASIKAIDEASCNSTNNTARLSRKLVGLERRFNEWIQSMQNFRSGPVDEALIQQWHQQARLIRQEVSRIDLQPTNEWASEMLEATRQLDEQLAAILKRTSGVNYAVKIDRLEYYQKMLDSHLNTQLERLYNMGNQTQQELDEILSIQEMMDNTSGSAIDMIHLNQSIFEEQLTILKNNVSNFQTPTLSELNRLADLLEKSQPFNQVPNVVPPEAIGKAHSLERVSNRIVAALDRDGVDRTLEVRESYKNIEDTLMEARAITDDAMRAIEAVGGEGVSAGSIEASLADIQKRHEKTVDRVQHLDDRLNDSKLIADANADRLATLKKSFADISVVLERTLETSKLTKERVNGQLSPLVTLTRPKLDALAEEVMKERKTFNRIDKEVRAIEKQFNEIEGTANMAVNQANSTQRSLFEMIAKTEERAEAVDRKMATARRLASLARSLLDLTYGSLGKDPIPLRLSGGDCTYTLVPYHTTRSRVFDLEFWFAPALLRRSSTSSPITSSATGIRTNSVLLVGRRAFPARTSMFAVTVEPNRNLRFAWSQPDVVGGELGIEIGPLNGSTTNRVRVIGVSGRVDLYLQEVPKDRETLDGLPTRLETYIEENDGESLPTGLLLDNQLELRVGGAFHSTSTSELNAPPLESWGEGGAEEMWRRLMKMEHAKGCLYELKIAGHRLGFPDFAKADPACLQQTEDFCKIHTNFRPIVRDGYVWEKTAALKTGLTITPSRSRPREVTSAEVFLEYMQLHDFAATDAYARITSYDHISPCDRTLNIHLQKLAPQIANSMVLTFYNYREDYGITVESKGYELFCSRWHGNLKGGISHRTRSIRPIRVSPIASNYWALEERVAEDCALAREDDYVFFLGGIPPGHFELRKAMKEYGLSTSGFRGRIGLATSGDHMLGSILIDSYTKTPIRNYGDTRFADIRQTEEAYAIKNISPSNQYCLTLMPLTNYTSFELKPSKFSAPWLPEISMTVRFRPVGNDEINLLRMQVAEQNNLWFRVWLTSDLRVGIAIPSDPTKFITREIFGAPVIRDPANNLAALKAREAQVFQQPLFTESVLTLRFGGPEFTRLTVLFDQRPVHTWKLSQSIPKSAVLQVYVGPELNTLSYYGFSISNLIIGKHRVDFANDVVDSLRNRPFYRFGECGGQLRPRFLTPSDESHPSPTTEFVYQGLDLSAPPAGRRLRSVFEDCGDINPQLCEAISDNVTKEWPIIIHSLLSPKPSRRVRVRSMQYAGNGKSAKNCREAQASSAWFNGEAHWEVENVAKVLSGNPDFRVTIGFRTREQNDSKNTVGLIGAFNFGFKAGTFFILLGERQIHLVVESGADGNSDFYWSSPLLDLRGNAWHRLELLPVNMETKDARRGVQITKMRFILDYHEAWIEEPITWRVPVSAFIGGYPTARTVRMGSETVNLANLFGCVDELALGGQEFDLSKSRLPPCPDCFVLDPKAVHVLPKVQDIIQPDRGLLLPLNLNVDSKATENMTSVKFSFEVLYDAQVIGVESLFVMVFENLNEPEEPIRIWIYLDRYMVYVTDITMEEKVSFSISTVEPLAWHYASVKISMQEFASIIEISTQGESAQSLIMNTVGPLRGIFYGSDEEITPQMQSDHHSGAVVPPFMGCLRNLKLFIDERIEAEVEFPESGQHLVHGVCTL